MLRKIDFSRYFSSPEELAKQVLQVYFNSTKCVYPINPFNLLNSLGVTYQFRNFDKLEGIYIVPDDEDDIPIVGINNNRLITRQRFTAAHEICHHVKDKKDIYCPIAGNKNSIEVFADKFAAELLMPISELERISNQYLENGFISFDNVILVSDYFGVSFEACVYKLAWKLNRISGDTAKAELKKRITAYKPSKKRIDPGPEKL